MKDKLYKWLQIVLSYFYKNKNKTTIQEKEQIISSETIASKLVTLDQVPPEFVIFYKLELHEHSTSLTYNEKANNYIIEYLLQQEREIKYLECININNNNYVIAASQRPENIKAMLLLLSLYCYIKNGSEKIFKYLIQEIIIDKQKILIFKD